MSSHCDDSTPSCTTDSTGGSSTSSGGSPAVEELVELFDRLSPGLDGRASFSVLPPPRLPSLHTQQRIPVQYRRYSSSTPYCDEDADSSGSDEMEATARAIRALAPERRRPYQTVSRSANLLTTPAVGSPKPQGMAANALALSLGAPVTEPLSSSRSTYRMSSSEADVELFLRLNHARQTMDFVNSQSASFAQLNRARMTVPRALGLLSTMNACQAALLCCDGGGSAEVPLLQHAYQTAELCRLAHPDKEWLHVVGLIHSLGNLLAHACLGSQPHWAVCSESFPVGCRPSPHICGNQYFSTNPDRRRRLYTSATGCYSAFCGLSNLAMSWSGSEYLHTMLLLNRNTQPASSDQLPREAMFLLRHQNFKTLTRTRRLRAERAGSGGCGSGLGSSSSKQAIQRGNSCGAADFGARVEQSSGSGSWPAASGSGAGFAAVSGCYSELLSEQDTALLPLLAEFQGLLCGGRLVQLPAEALQGAALVAHYDSLLERYFGGAELRW
ncbi:MAG: hypothetical protein WDW36_002269 [Sanguina aurantia]